MRKDVVNKTKSGTISMKGFGAVKSEFIALTNKLKTLYNKNIIYVFHSQEEKDKDGIAIQRLLCEGSARNIVWQPCDFGCYLHMRNGKRVAGFSPTDEYFAKGCYGIEGLVEIPTLNDTDTNDFLTRLFEKARNNIAKESEFFEAEKIEHGKIMEQGKALVEKVVDEQTANNFADEFKKLTHKLTSEVEIKAVFKEKLTSLGIAWDKQKMTYTKKEQ